MVDWFDSSIKNSEIITTHTFSSPTSAHNVMITLHNVTLVYVSFVELVINRDISYDTRPN